MTLPLSESYREIPLTKRQVAKVSPEDYERVSALSWYAQWSGTTHSFYAWRREGTKAVTMHGFILGQKADHFNHDTLDNQRHNLRPASQRQNSQYRRTPRNNTSGFKGVTRYGTGWKAYIQPNGTFINLGVFSEKEDAARAYDAKAIELFGEFACTNFPH